MLLLQEDVSLTDRCCSCIGVGVAMFMGVISSRIFGGGGAIIFLPIVDEPNMAFDGLARSGLLFPCGIADNGALGILLGLFIAVDGALGGATFLLIVP
jgi:hypothetical protein